MRRVNHLLMVRDPYDWVLARARFFLSDTFQGSLDNIKGGNVAVAISVASNERGGQRRIVVQAEDGTAAGAPVDVVESNDAMIGMPGFGLGG